MTHENQDSQTGATSRKGLRAGLVLIGVLLVWLVFRPSGESPLPEVGDSATYATPAPFERGVFATLPAERGILIHCGNSMRPLAEAAKEFMKLARSEWAGQIVRYHGYGPVEKEK